MLWSARIETSMSRRAAVGLTDSAEANCRKQQRKASGAERQDFSQRCRGARRLVARGQDRSNQWRFARSVTNLSIFNHNIDIRLVRAGADNS
jgi:hypothetical protein